MKGVILAGGNGRRLDPLTAVTNKHLLPVYDRPMVYYPIRTLLDAGLRDILIVSGKEHAGGFLKLLGSGKSFGCRFSYEVQEEAGGIAQALALAEHFADGDCVAVILGDNIFEDSVAEEAKRFAEQRRGSHIFLKEVADPERFGVAEVADGKVIGIEEKPANPKSRYAVTGLYLYGPDVFDVIRTIQPSYRGELEITDVNNHYVRNETMSCSFVAGEWTDAGTFESLYRASRIARAIAIGQSRIDAGSKMKKQ